MKKVNMLKKLMSFGLAVALFVTSPASVYALDAEGTSVVSMADENVEEEKVATPEPISGEEKSDSDIQLEDEGKSVPSEDPADDELNTDSPRAGIADEDFVKEDEAAQDDVEKAEEEAACEHSEFRYESNGDGTHKKICKDCDEVVAEKEPCEFDENGKCVLCGYEDPEHKFTLTDENGIVKVTGTKAVLNGATRVVAKEITADENKTELDKMADALDEEVAKESKSVVDFVAYDITLYDDNGPVTINKEAGNVTVVFTQLEVEGLADNDKKTEVYHYADNTETVEQMKSEQISDDTVEMETSHFSYYLIAITNNGSPLARSEYLTVESVSGTGLQNKVDFGSKPNKNSVSDNQRTINITVHVDGKTVVFPSENKVFKTSSNSNKRAILRITPKEGYIIDSVTANEIYKTDNWTAQDADGAKEGSEQLKGYLKSVTNSDVAKDVKIGIGAAYNGDFVPATKVHIYLKKAEDIVTVNNARFVNIKKDRETPMATVINDKGAVEKAFRFVTNGIENSASDKYYTDAIHEGMASDTIRGYRFRLNDNVFATQKKFFDNPLEVCVDSQEEWQHEGVVYPYDGAVYNAGIEFYKDGDYYTLDSDEKTYRLYDNNGNKVTPSKLYDGGTLKIEKNDGEKFLPFGNDSSNKPEYNFGMIIPVKFSINENGMTGNNNTVFEFSGDDDVYVYIDGKLALDLGGIHNKVDGKIDFKTGDVTVTFNTYQPTTSTQKNIYTDLKLADDVRSFSKKQHSLTFVYFERGSNQSNCKIKFNFDPEDIEVEEEGYTKNITVEKTWVDDNNKSNSRPSKLEFEVYGKYTDKNQTDHWLVKEDGIVSEVNTRTAYDTITLTADDKDNSNANKWKKTVEGFPVFANGGTDDLISWELVEKPVVGYTAGEIDKTAFTNPDIEYELEPPKAELSARGNQYNHIDVELWTAKTEEGGGRAITGIQNFEGDENYISIYGWSPDYTSNGKAYTIKTWNPSARNNIDVFRDTSTNEFSTRDYTKCNGTFCISDATKIAFKVRFEGDTEYRLVIFDSDAEYPKDTIVEAPTRNTEPYKNYTRICDAFRFKVGNSYPDSIKLDGLNVYDVSRASCGIGPSQGLDLLLTEKLLHTYEAKENTGDEIYKITNTQNKSEVKTKVSKTAEIKNWADRTYTITLGAKAKEITETSTTTNAAVNVVLVIDTSNSMLWPRELVSQGNRYVSSLSRETTYYYWSNSQLKILKWHNNAWRSANADDYVKKPETPNWSSYYPSSTTVYTSNSPTRLAITQKAACEFIDSIAKNNPDSKVGIISFNKTAKQEKGLTVLSKNNVDDLKKSINNLSCGSGTNQYYGLRDAANLLKPDSKDTNAIVLITDGLFNRGQDINESDRTTYVNNAHKVATVYSVGINLSGEDDRNKAIALLEQLASKNENNEPHFKLLNDNDSLENFLQNVSDEITSSNETGLSSTVTDVIDPRFELIGENGKPVTTVNAEYYDDNNVKQTVEGSYNSATRTITWSVPKTNDFKAVFTVKAKDDFFGGNVITTNGSFSGMKVNVEGQDPIEFDKPTVNVKLLDLDLTNEETTVLLNDEFNAVASSEKKAFLEGVNASYTDNQGKVHKVENVFANSLTAGTNDKFNYSYPGTNDVVGTVELTNQTIGAASAATAGDNVYSYENKVTYTPVKYADRSKADIVEPTADNTVEAIGTYKVNVVDAGIYGLKLGGAAKAALNGATYEVFDSTGKVIKELTSADVRLNNKTEKGLFFVDGLGVGTYKVKEKIAPTGYALSNEEFTLVIAKTETASQYTLTVTTNGDSEVSEAKTFSVLGAANEGVIDTGYLYDADEKKITSNESTYLYNPNDATDFTVVINTTKLAAFSPVDMVAYTLPETGGRGVYVYTIGGVLLMLGACLLLYKNKKNKNK